MRRTGSEPVQARSPLRLRLGLALFGVVWATVAAVGFALTGHPGWTAVLAAIAAIALVDVLLIIRRMRQGPHFQPGRSVPPYLPVERRDRHRTGRR